MAADTGPKDYLLTDVMRYLDGERPRAAAKLHEQATSLYTTLAQSGADEAIGFVRTDLARRVDDSRRMLTAMRSSDAE